MKSRKLEDWLQIVGLFSVVGSMVFVGFQLKQDREIALSQIWQDRTATVVASITGIASNEMALSAFAKAGSGRLDEIKPVEEQAALWEVIGSLVLWESSHYQHTLGFLPEEHWERIQQDIKRSLRDPFWRPMMLESLTIMRSSFAAVVEGLNREVSAEQN